MPRPPASPAAPTPARSSITAKLTLVLLLVALVPMTAIAYLNLRVSVDTLAASEQEGLKNLAASTAGRLDQLIEGIGRIVNYMAINPGVVEYMRRPGDPAAQAQVEAFLDRIEHASGDIESLYLMDMEGVFVAATNRAVLGKDYDFRDYFRVARDGRRYISDLLVGSTSGQTGVYFSAPIRADEGPVLGVVVLKLQGEAVLRVLRQVNDTALHVQASLINADGVVIAHPDPGFLYRSLGYLSPRQAEEIQAHARFPVAAIESLGLPDLARAMLEAKGPGYQRYHLPPSGMAKVMGYAPLRTHFWTVGVSEPEEVFVAPLNRLFHQGMTSVGLMGLLVGVLALYLSRHMVRPLRTLTEVTRRLSGAADVGGADAQALRRLGEGRGDELGELARHIGDLAGRPAQPDAPAKGRGFDLEGDFQDELSRISATHRDEIGQLAQTFDEMVMRLREYIADLKLVTAAKATMESEMRFAADIQRGFLPAAYRAEPGREALDLDAFIRPAKQVGGDLYDFFFVDDEHLFFVIGDVSDKGMPAALFMGMTLALIRNLAAPERGPGEIFAEVNRTLARNNDACQFVTLFGGVLDLRDGSLAYANGGHNPPYRRLAVTGRVERVAPGGGPALGCFEEAQFRTGHLTLAPGDLLFTYTDGVTEATDAQSALYGDGRLEACLAGAPAGEGAAGLVARVVEDVRGFVAEAPQSDDITVLCLRYLGRAA